jgi:hypothetical protein
MEPRRDRWPREALAIRPAAQRSRVWEFRIVGLASASEARSEKKRASTLTDVQYRNWPKTDPKQDRKSSEQKISLRASQSATSLCNYFSENAGNFRISLFRCSVVRALFAICSAPVSMLFPKSPSLCRSAHTARARDRARAKSVELSAAPGAMPFAHARERRGTTMQGGGEDPPGGSPTRPPCVWVHCPRGIFQVFETEPGARHLPVRTCSFR